MPEKNTNDVATAALYLAAGLAKHLNRKGLLSLEEVDALIADIDQTMAGNPQRGDALAIIRHLFPGRG